MSGRPQKIAFAQMRNGSARGLLVYCSDYKCSHPVTSSGDHWPDEMRLSDLEPRFVWDKPRVPVMAIDNQRLG